MAPEVVQQKVHTTAADIWSVGCLVVEMLTGEHPWAQLTQTQAIFKVRKSQLSPTPHLLTYRYRSVSQQSLKFRQIYLQKRKSF